MAIDDKMLLRFMWVCACFLCAALTALASHYCIDQCMSFLGHDTDYDSYEHVAIGPIFVAACAAAVVLLARSIMLILASRARCDVVVFTSRWFSTIFSKKLLPITVLTAIVMLCGIEFYEQCSEFGHIEGIAEALGGNIAFGLSVIFTASCAILGLIRLSAWLLFHVASISYVFAVGLFIAKDRCVSTVGMQRAKEVRRSVLLHDEPLLAYCQGLRAPPRFDTI